MDKSGLFIKRFQRLEKLLKETTESKDETSFSSALTKAAEKNTFIQKNRSLIDDLYALRNVFSHRERQRYIAKVNEIAISELEKIIQNIEKPPTVISRFKGYGETVYQATIDRTIFEVMSEMEDPKKKYTHVPVWNRSKFVGVFSYTSFFAWLFDEQKNKDKEVTFVKKFIGDINPEYLNSPVVNFEFIPENMSLYEVPSLFEKAVSQRERLDCLLITRAGKRNEKITGIITSWDLGSI